MSLCPYFLQGNCKFGKKCRYSHGEPSYNDHSEFLSTSKQFNDIALEVIMAERGNQWPLSCYAPIRDRPTIPKLEDTSPEELRQHFYEAKKQGRISEYIKYANQLSQNAQEVKNFLKEPSDELGILIQNIMANKTETSDPKSTFKFSLDGQNPNIFGNSQQQLAFAAPPPAPPAFAPQTPPAPAATGFAPPSANIFGGSAEKQKYQSFSSNVFSSGPSLFSQQPPSVPNQSSNIFAGQPRETVFVNPQQPVLSNSNRMPNDATTYSTELTDEEKSIYMASVFAFGKIPQTPPTKSLC